MFLLGYFSGTYPSSGFYVSAFRQWGRSYRVYNGEEISVFIIGVLYRFFGNIFRLFTKQFSRDNVSHFRDVMVLFMCIFKRFNVGQRVSHTIRVIFSQRFSDGFCGLHSTFLHFSVNIMLFQTRRLLRWYAWLCLARYSPRFCITRCLLRSTSVLNREFRFSRAFLRVFRLQASGLG